jgi:two-component system sensor kinase FixL
MRIVPTSMFHNPLPNDAPADSLSRQYRVALGLVAMLVVLNQVLVWPSLLRLSADAPVINLAGRQRMLSQKLAKTALALDREVGDKRPSRLEELDQVLRDWSAAHEGLRYGNAAMPLPGKNSDAVIGAIDGLEPFFARMRDAADRLLRSPARSGSGQAETSQEITTILEAEPEYLKRMDHVVSLLEGEARRRAWQLAWTGWGLTCLIVAALGAIGGFIVRPAVKLIRGQVDELRRGRDELEERVRERAKDLERAGERQRALVERFSHVARTTTIGEMASGLAHELKQPLGAIANYAEGCLVELSGTSPAIPEVKASLEKLVAATLRAGQIIERIRDFVTRGELRREWFDPNRLVTQVEEFLRDEAARYGVAIELLLAPDLPKLEGDPVQVQQVLVNLVRNALEAIIATKPVPPKLVVQTRPTNCGEVEFAVTDDGEGIKPEQLDRVFDAYFSTRAGGLGMGLPISRTIVEAHQGRLTVSSRPGVTTTFQFTLPVSVSSGDDAGSYRLHRG